MIPTFEYSHDRILLVFAATPEAFGTARAAQTYLEERGFSVGRMQGVWPRGILYGKFDIQKWRHLRSSDIEALHGHMSGPLRTGPITVGIFASAPEAARWAIARRMPLRPSPPGGRVLESLTTAAAAITLGLVAALLIWTAMPTIRGYHGADAAMRLPSFAKIALRAGRVDHDHVAEAR